MRSPQPRRAGPRGGDRVSSWGNYRSIGRLAPSRSSLRTHRSQMPPGLAAPARGGSVLRCRIGHVYTDEDLLAHDGEEIDKTLPQHLERPLLAAAASGARSRARPDRRPELKVDPAGLEPATSTLPASRSPN